MIRRLTIFLVLQLPCLFLFAQFRDVPWGASKEEAISAEGVVCGSKNGRINPCLPTILMLDVRVVDAYATAAFYFADDKLTHGAYLYQDDPYGHRNSQYSSELGFTQPQSWKLRLRERFDELESLLNSKYSDAVSVEKCDSWEGENWFDWESSCDRSLATIVWRTESTQVELEMIVMRFTKPGYVDPHKSFDLIEMSLLYKSIELYDWGMDWREQKSERDSRQRDDAQRDEKLKKL